MNLFSGTISVLLSLILTGGGQFCAAVCASAQQQTPPAPVKVGCSRCERKKVQTGKSRPAPDCKHCIKTGKDQLAPDRASLKAPALVAILPAPLPATLAPALVPLAQARLNHGPPPVPLLHQICVLLI